MKQVTVAGGTLFHLAAAHLGDALQWHRIAALNGLSDPVLRGVLTVRLPDPDPAQSGGVARQGDAG